MLTSITPLGERGRGQRWGLTASALTIGHLLGGALLGGVMALVGAAVALVAGTVGTTVQVVVVAVAALLAAGFDLSGRTLPGRRQVDETWLTTYRGWVYGLGFGVQLGLGFVTVVNTALFLAVVVAGIVVGAGSAGALAAIAVGVGYGAVRAVLAIANARVRTVEQLKGLHRRLDAADGRVRIGGAVMTTVATLVAAGMVMA